MKKQKKQKKEVKEMKEPKEMSSARFRVKGLGAYPKMKGPHVEEKSESKKKKFGSFLVK